MGDFKHLIFLTLDITIKYYCTYKIRKQEASEKTYNLTRIKIQPNLLTTYRKISAI